MNARDHTARPPAAAFYAKCAAFALALAAAMLAGLNLALERERERAEARAEEARIRAMDPPSQLVLPEARAMICPEGESEGVLIYNGREFSVCLPDAYASPSP